VQEQTWPVLLALNLSRRDGNRADLSSDPSRGKKASDEDRLEGRAKI